MRRNDGLRRGGFRASRLTALLLLSGTTWIAGCRSGGVREDEAVQDSEAAANVASVGSTSGRATINCVASNAGITLPDGFCAVVFADSVGRARHAAATGAGILYVALASRRSERGGIVALRDTNGDGTADVRARFGDNGGTGIALRGEWLYFSPDDAVLRYRIEPGVLEPVAGPDTIVRGLPSDRSHQAKSIAVSEDGALYVNIGSPTNSCQARDRQPSAPGIDPCPDLESRAGVWVFDANRLGQTQQDGQRFATGLRNTVALALNPRTGVLYGTVHGRDQLFQNWPDLYDAQQSAESPAEEFVRIDRGDDFGWPYCYYDTDLDRKVLSPEYGGNRGEVGRCANKEAPLISFPGHWGPNGLLFYTGEQFPERYRGGAFIAFHGSWNRAPLPQAGFNVAFVPFADGRPAGQWSVFADGFAGENKARGPFAHRPVGLAQGPDGSLYVTDDQAGRVYRVVYRGG